MEHLPINHSTRKYVYFMVIFRMWMPKLRSLPIDSSDEAPNHRVGRLLHFREPEVCDLGGVVGGDENVGRLAVTVDDRRLP